MRMLLLQQAMAVATKAHSDAHAGMLLALQSDNRKNSNDYAYGTLIDRDEDEESLGLALRYYAENLNSTEFGLYYQKYDSRIPYFNVQTGRPTVNYAAVVHQFDFGSGRRCLWLL